jgi:hypothetical protein
MQVTFLSSIIVKHFADSDTDHIAEAQFAADVINEHGIQ